MSDDRRSKRLEKLPDLDYKKLHKTGEKILKPVIPKLPQSDLQGEGLPSSSNNEQSSITDSFVLTGGQLVETDDNDSFHSFHSDETLANVDTKISDSESVFDETVVPAVLAMVQGEKDLLSKLNIIVEDLTDYIDENSMHASAACYYTVEDVDACILKVETVRTSIRQGNSQMRDLVGDTKFTDKYNSTLTKNLERIKEYIRAAREKKSALRNNDNKLALQDRQFKVSKEHEVIVQKQATANFLVNEITRSMQKLNSEFLKDNDDYVDDEEIESRKSQLSENLRETENLSNKFQKVLETMPESTTNKARVIAELTESYDEVIKNKDVYKRTLLDQIKVRELEKEKSFSASSVNIKLEKFKGFASELDIYSFKTEFGKLYKKMPSSKLPDLLKHNHLENPALAMVKSLDKLDEIWDRLQKAYGDPKTILSKLLANVKSLGPIWKLKNSDEIKDALVNLINGIRDLIRVAKQHNIEAKLYNGEGLEIIYTSMGENRVTRWLTGKCDDELTDEQLWERLLQFLERDLRVQQEKALYCRKPQDDSRTNPRAHHGECHYGEDACSFCGEGGHVKSNGPNGIQLIQYYACKKFVESTAQERFRGLRSKNFCYQCLYPGAKFEGKHANGTCQSSFVCKHESHVRHPCKKHVLVCHEHCELPQNIETLQTYKRKYILNYRNLEEFSRNIQLSFYTGYKVSVPRPLSLIPRPNDDMIIT